MFGQVLTTEFMKLRRSKVTWGTLAVFSLAPLAIALFMWIVREPGRAAQLGLLGAKANLAGLEATWPAYVSMLSLVVGFAGMILLAFIVAYLFGREYVEMTAKNMLALPVGRHWFVVAKLIVAAAWWLALVVAVQAEGFAVGALLALPGFTAALAPAAIGNALASAGISFLLVPVVAWMATLGRGYMPPLAFALAALALGNVFGKTGWAVWFPWSIIPLLIGAVGKPVSGLPAGSYVVAGITFLAGVAATVAQMRWADTAQ
jgi:ABC-type transport system involved in multi-copper enzyme maturation permease subunit